MSMTIALNDEQQLALAHGELVFVQSATNQPVVLANKVAFADHIQDQLEQLEWLRLAKRSLEAWAAENEY